MSERIIPIDWRERTEQALRSGLTQFAIMAQRQILRDEILAANPDADLSFFSDADETPTLQKAEPMNPQPKGTVTV